jgi:hypothetical protein
MWNGPDKRKISQTHIVGGAMLFVKGDGASLQRYRHVFLFDFAIIPPRFGNICFFDCLLVSWLFPNLYTCFVA